MEDARIPGALREARRRRGILEWSTVSEVRVVLKAEGPRGEGIHRTELIDPSQLAAPPQNPPLCLQEKGLSTAHGFQCFF
jgi:hypothetical protein